MTYTLIQFTYLGHSDPFDNIMALIPSSIVPDWIDKCHCYHIGGPEPSYIDKLVEEIEETLCGEWKGFKIKPNVILEPGDRKIDKVIMTGRVW